VLARATGWHLMQLNSCGCSPCFDGQDFIKKFQDMGKICSLIQIQGFQYLEVCRNSVRLLTTMVVIFFVLGFSNVCGQEAPTQGVAQAQAPAGRGPAGTSGIGINAVLSHMPQEEDLSDTGGKQEIDKFEIYLDLSWLRVAYNMTHAEYSFNAYNQSWKTALKKDTTYAAYRLSSADGQSKWDLFLLAGIAYTEASFSISRVSKHSSADFGFVTGGGAFYRMGRFDVGAQMLVISTEGEFDGIEIATGSTQMLYGMKLVF